MSPIRGPQRVLRCSWHGTTLWLWPSVSSPPPFAFLPGTQGCSHPDQCLWGLVGNLFQSSCASVCITWKSLPVGRSRRFLLWNTERGAPESLPRVDSAVTAPISSLATSHTPTVLLCADWNPQSQVILSSFFPKCACRVGVFHTWAIYVPFSGFLPHPHTNFLSLYLTFLFKLTLTSFTFLLSLCHFKQLISMESQVWCTGQ